MSISLFRCLKDNVQVNSEDIGAIAVLQNRLLLVLYLKKKKTTTKNYFGTGHEKKEFVCFSKSTSFYDTEQT